jgi:hypothetical protein
MAKGVQKTSSMRMDQTHASTKHFFLGRLFQWSVYTPLIIAAAPRALFGFTFSMNRIVQLKVLMRATMLRKS